ncbi:arginase family protein [Actibacterium ureilyticum]|uniref:arginase family protein n=1 Tax=Actibacterium ureilyticum TaxID=1590614 RepID=UPI000BAABC57|nr:arginase family protein [Actibacterium ureilyticum]
MTEEVNLGALFGADAVESFMGLPVCRDLSQVAASAALIGAPCATPYGAVGPYCRNAPTALRQAAAMLAANLDRHNFDIGGPLFPEGTQTAVDCGDIGWSETDFAANRAAIAGAVTLLMQQGAVPVVLGGDDSIPIPMLQALGTTGARYTVVQVDAHIDWRQSHMDEALGLSSTMRRASEMPHIERIIQVGARGIGSAASSDYQDALDWGARFFTARDVHRDGIAPVLDQIAPGAQVVVCLDVDALDPSIVPGVIGRAPGGLSYDQVLDLIRGVAGRGRIAAMDVVEYLPEADIGGLGAVTVSRLIAAVLGLLARQQAGLPIAQ